MAKINTKAARHVLDADGAAEARVGNNRVLKRTAAGTLIGELHGNPVAFLAHTPFGEKRRCLTLHTCGFRTRTTADAMAEFARLMGVEIKVSFAAGRFAVLAFDVTDIARPTPDTAVLTF